MSILSLEKSRPVINGQADRFRSEHELSFELEDLQQEGVLVYFSCIKSYDESKGASFRTYLSNAIWKRFLEIARKERKHSCLITESMLDDDNDDSIMDSFMAPSSFDPYNLSFSPALSNQAQQFLDYTLYGSYNGETGQRKMTKTLVAEKLGMSRHHMENVRKEILEKVILTC